MLFKSSALLALGASAALASPLQRVKRQDTTTAAASTDSAASSTVAESTTGTESVSGSAAQTTASTSVEATATGSSAASSVESAISSATATTGASAAPNTTTREFLYRQAWDGGKAKRIADPTIVSYQLPMIPHQQNMPLAAQKATL